ETAAARGWRARDPVMIGHRPHGWWRGQRPVRGRPAPRAAASPALGRGTAGRPGPGAAGRGRAPRPPGGAGTGAAFPRVLAAIRLAARVTPAHAAPARSAPAMVSRKKWFPVVTTTSVVMTG